jgi:alternate signal-mediated exported protein
MPFHTNTNPETGGPTPVIVVNRRRRNMVPAFVVAGALGLAAAAGGGTWALWSASDTSDGGTITAGDLNIQADQTLAYDVSPDRLDTSAVPGTDLTGHAIDDLATYRVVPGDEVALVTQADVTLDGDNLVASLAIELGDAAKALTGNLTVQLYDDTGQPATAPQTLPTGTKSAITYLSAPMTGQDAGASDATTGVIELDDTTQTFTVVVTNTFDASVDQRTQVTLADVMGQLELSLEQVRGAGQQSTP